MGDLDFESTVEGMLSKDYKERFKAELKQLRIRVFKLQDLIIRFHKGGLDFELSCPIWILVMQLQAMQNYLDILYQRADIEGIDWN